MPFDKVLEEKVYVLRELNFPPAGFADFVQHAVSEYLRFAEEELPVSSTTKTQGQSSIDAYAHAELCSQESNVSDCLVGPKAGTYASLNLGDVERTIRTFYEQIPRLVTNFSTELDGFYFPHRNGKLPWNVTSRSAYLGFHVDVRSLVSQPLHFRAEISLETMGFSLDLENIELKHLVPAIGIRMQQDLGTDGLLVQKAIERLSAIVSSSYQITKVVTKSERIILP